MTVVGPGHSISSCGKSTELPPAALGSNSTGLLSHPEQSLLSTSRFLCVKRRESLRYHRLPQALKLGHLLESISHVLLRDQE